MSRALVRAQRLQRLDELLLAAPRGLTTEELAKQLNIHRTTVWRDLRDLMETVPIYQDGDRYSIDRATYLTNVRLSAGESLMLHLALRIMIRRMTHMPPVCPTGLQPVALAMRDPPPSDLIESLTRPRSEPPLGPHRARACEVLVQGWLEQVTAPFVYQKFQAEPPAEYETQ